jgi:hypothetical protein
MIYLPKRALFIHIPRTAGNSITNAIASSCAGNNIDIVIGTCVNVYGFYNVERHVTAYSLYSKIKEWDNIFKFAIYRPQEERVESFFRLIERDRKNKELIESSVVDEEWKSILRMSNYKEYLLNLWKKDGIDMNSLDYFIRDQNGNDLGVELFDYNNLQNLWPEICDKCQIPRCELPYLNKG